MLDWQGKDTGLMRKTAAFFSLKGTIEYDWVRLGTMFGFLGTMASYYGGGLRRSGWREIFRTRFESVPLGNPPSPRLRRDKMGIFDMVFGLMRRIC